MLEKIPLVNKIKKKSHSQIESGQSSDLSSDQTANFAKQKELDKKLVHSLNQKKIPTLKQFKHLKQVLSPKQKLLVKGLIVLTIASLIFMGGNFYFKNFLPSPKIGGEYIEGLIGAPQYINPLLSQTNDVDFDISRLIFSGLLKYNRELQLMPELAESWEENEEEKSYTFVLKENLKWHDGQPLTADDVIFTFQSIKDPDFKSPLLISFRGIEIEKIDERTVKFILPESYPAFLEILTVGILPEHIWGEIPPINANLTEYNLKPIGSGPWKLEKFFKDKLGNIKSYVLIPNPDYYGPKPYLEKLTFKFYPDFETAVEELKNQSIEGISFLPKELKAELKSRKSLKYYSFYLPQYTAVFFNQKNNEILKNKKIRTALALSIDKSKILTEALQLEGEIIDGPILPVDVTLDPDKKINFDPKAANQILEELGWEKITPLQYQEFITKQEEAEAEAKAKEAEDEEEDNEETDTAAEVVKDEEDEPDSTPDEEKIEEDVVPEEDAEIKPIQPFYRQKDDKILEITLTTVSQPENNKAAELIQEFWQNIGVKVNLEIIEGGNKIKRDIIKPRNYQVLLFGINVGSNPDPYPFWHSSQIQDPGLNLAMLANRDVDKLLEDGKETTDEEKQRENYQGFQNILTTEIPAIFLYTPTYTYAVDQKIKGIDIDRVILPVDRFNNLEDWYIKTERKYQGAID